MNKRFCLLGSVTAALFGMSLQVVAQTIPTASQLLAVMNPEISAVADSVLRFETTEYSLGELSEDSGSVTRTFVAQNVSKHQVAIEKLRTTCGCTTATSGKKLLEPGDTTQIHVTFNPANQPGKLYVRVFVYADADSNRPIAALSLTGSVTPSASLWKDYRYSMGTLRLRRKSVDFENVSEGQQRSERIPCANAGSSPLHIRPVKGFIPDYLDVKTEPETLEPSQTGEIVITLKVNKSVLSENGKAIISHILLDGLDVRPSERMLRVSVSSVVGQ